MKNFRNSFVRRLLDTLAWVAFGLANFTVVTQAQLVDLSSTPLYSGTQAHPNVIVDASIEFPSVVQAYNATRYVAATAYVGYFDPTKCYVYNITANYGNYFSPVPGVAGNADSLHRCDGTTFSGSFMNWMSMSSMDVFRYAMTGGNRVNENGPNGGTILQRAYAPDGTVPGIPDFYNSQWFPQEVLSSSFLVCGSATPPCFGSFAPSFTVDANGNQVGGFYTAVPASTVLPVLSALTVYIHSCRTFIYLGPFNGGNCSAPDSLYGSYDIRVLVCDAVEGPNRTDLCLQYGGSTGKYKPVGQAQINAAQMRFAVFGYSMDHNVNSYTVNTNGNPNCLGSNTNGWNACRYGGLLRAPMKYLGPTAYNGNLVPSTNANAEINADGTLVTDPDGTASSVGGTYSGFINFINKFGSNPVHPGTYKLFDTMGEMYYESIRYLQGLQPTADAYQGLTDNGTVDNFPIYTNWADPIVAVCASNYIINVSDANTNYDSYVPGYLGVPGLAQGNGGGYFPPPSTVRTKTRAATSGLDAYAWTQAIGALESSTPSLSTNDVRPGLNGIESRWTGAGNDGTYFPAGIAYWANTNDIRAYKSSTPNATPTTVTTISFDVAEPVTVAVPDRQLYLMGKYGGFSNTINAADPTQINPFYLTAATNGGQPVRSNAKWEDSPGSGYPANYLLANDPLKLVTGLRNAFAKISSTTGTLSGGSVISANLTYASTGAFVATFNSKRWSGTVQRNTLQSINGVLSVSAAPVWDAGALLTTRCGTVASASTTCSDTDTSVNARNIVTTVQTVAGTRVATNFTYANVSASTDVNYLAMLNTDPATSIVDAQGSARLNYLRGYRGGEAIAPYFRGRDSPLGDIVNSAPIFVGTPSTSITDTDYQTFFANNVARTPAVYVGANDGMLHAFDANVGTELFAYIPRFIASYISDLSNPAYGNTHEPFVDAVPAVAEAKVNGSWKTVLVSGTGAGGQGVFALDVTNPNAFAPSSVIFEFTDADDADLGNVTNSPEIVKLQNGGTTTAPTYGYYAVVTSYNNRRAACRSNGNGASLLISRCGVGGNSKGDTNQSTGTSNQGVMFLLSLDHTLASTWVLGSNYYKFTFPANNTAAANGLAPVSSLASKSGNGTTAALYFGDLQGSLWRLNTVGLPSAWTPARGTVAAPLPIFIASPSTGVYQPITARPELGTGPYGTTLVVFGTGEYLGASDLGTPYALQSEYVLIDNNSGTLINRSSDLQPRTGVVSGNFVSVTGTPYTYPTKKGWYINFPSSTSLGERSVSKPAIRTGLLTFTTQTLAGSVCTAGGGYIYQLNALTGLPYVDVNNNVVPGGFVSTVGIPGPPKVVDLSVTAGQSRATGEQINQRTLTTLVSGSSGGLAGVGVTPPIKVPPVGRLSWREITNYNDQTKTP